MQRLMCHISISKLAGSILKNGKKKFLNSKSKRLEKLFVSTFYDIEKTIIFHNLCSIVIYLSRFGKISNLWNFYPTLESFESDKNFKDLKWVKNLVVLCVDITFTEFISTAFGNGVYLQIKFHYGNPKNIKKNQITYGSNK